MRPKFSYKAFPSLKKERGHRATEICTTSSRTTLTNLCLEREEMQSHLQNLVTMQHNCLIKGLRVTQIGANWLNMMLNRNHVDTRQLIEDIVFIMDKKTTKVNRLCFC